MTFCFSSESLKHFWTSFRNKLSEKFSPNLLNLYCFYVVHEMSGYGSYYNIVKYYIIFVVIIIFDLLQRRELR